MSWICPGKQLCYTICLHVQTQNSGICWETGNILKPGIQGDQLVANATQNSALATKVFKLVASGWPAFFYQNISHYKRKDKWSDPCSYEATWAVVEVLFKEALSVLMLCAPVFIFTSGSSALLGCPHCGLSIWLSLCTIFRPATIHFSPIQLSWYDTHDTIRYITTKQGYCLVGSDVCTADKPSRKHVCFCCVCHIEYNAKHCSAWIFLVSLFGKSLCIRTKKRKEGEH